VLRLIATGRGNRAIAAARRISGRTVERRVTNSYGKGTIGPRGTVGGPPAPSATTWPDCPTWFPPARMLLAPIPVVPRLRVRSR
jgi:hypothetical protein